MKKEIITKALFIVILLSVFFIMSCTGGGPNREGPIPFIGGSEGLTMDFALGAPPEEIFDSSQFPFSVNMILENVGENDVKGEDAIVKLVGIEPTLFSVTYNEIEDKLPQDLRGAAKLTDGTEVPGDITTVVFPKSEDKQFNYIPDLMGTDEMKIRAEVCYYYKSKSTTQICIKDQVLDNLYNDKICVVNEDKFPQNSGSPIHVSALRETPQGKNDVAITFKIEHVGTGLFFKPGTPCDDSIQNPNENIVKVTAYFAEAPGYTPPKINCPLFRGGTTGFVNLFQGQPREIRCVIHGDNDSDRIYQDLLHIDLDYRYMNYVEKLIIIRDVSK